MLWRLSTHARVLIPGLICCCMVESLNEIIDRHSLQADSLQNGQSQAQQGQCDNDNEVSNAIASSSVDPQQPMITSPPLPFVSGVQVDVSGLKLCNLHSCTISTCW